MSITPSFLKKLFSISIIAIFSISLIFLGLSNTQTKTASAYEFSIQTACQNAADNEYYYNRNSSNYYYVSQIKNDYCSSAAFRCLFSNCSDGFNADNTLNKTCNFTIAQGFTNCGYNNGCYNYPCNTQYYDVYVNNNSYKTCVNCFEQAISQLQNGVNGYNQGSANINQDLLNKISDSERSDIPTAIASYVSGNSSYVEVKNYSGSVLVSSSFSIDERGQTTVNNSNSTYISPNCNRNFNLFICDSVATAQIANQFGSYGSLSIPFRSTFTIAPTQNNNSYYSNIAYNYPSIIYDYPIYTDYYYGYEDCNNTVFGCGY
jgi:hypothetical protein